MGWQDAWAAERTPWDAGEAAPELLRLLETGTLGSGRALVPGCGSGYDVFALEAAGFEATGLDIAIGAAKRFTELREQRRSSARIAISDFFTWKPAMGFDVIWDYTFLCALPPTWRHRWRARMHQLLGKGGTLVTLIFPNINPGPDYVGPPWPLTPGHMTTLMKGHFEARHLAPAEASHPSRKGKEWIGIWEAVAT